MPSRLRVPLRRSDTLTDRPDFALVGVLRVPEEQTSPGRAIVRRIGYALAALTAAVIVVYPGRDGYRDVQDNPVAAVGLRLLRHRVAVDHRLRRHHSAHPAGAAGKHPGHHAAASVLPHRGRVW